MNNSLDSTNLTIPNLPVMSIGRLVELLGQSYCHILQGGASPEVFPSVMLWGPPGVGKSQAIRQIAKKIEKETKKQVCVTDVRLLLFNPIDLRGIPTANEDKTLAVWLKPKIFQMDESEKTVNILFLDEISAAPQSVQAAAYQITLDRVVGEHRLPDNCFVIAAGNRVTDKSVAYKMPKALANRLLHIEVEGGFESWRKWAKDNGIHDLVTGYLATRHDQLFGFDPGSDDLAFATPRSWEMVSNLLNNVNEDPEQIYPLIEGLIGCGQAMEFRSWCSFHRDLPDVEQIFSGKVRNVPREVDSLYALVASMTAYAKEHKDDIWGIENSIQYARRMPADYSMLLMKNYMTFGKNFKDLLVHLPAYLDWAGEKGSVLNGIG